MKNGLILDNVLVIPEFKHNLLSVNKLTESGKCKVNFFAGHCMIVDHDSSELKGIGECRNGLYYLLNDDMEKVIASLKQMTLLTVLNAANNHVEIKHGWVETEKHNEAMLWHLRLGHVPIQKLLTMNLNLKSRHTSNTQTICVTCPMAKLTKLPFPHSQSHASYPFELLHIDIWGPYKVQTRGKHKFFLTVVDDHTRTTWVTLLQQKSEAFEALANFVKIADTQFNHKVRAIRSDNALEFQDDQSKQLYNNSGIIH